MSVAVTNRLWTQLDHAHPPTELDRDCTHHRYTPDLQFAHIHVQSHNIQTDTSVVYNLLKTGALNEGRDIRQEEQQKELAKLLRCSSRPISLPPAQLRDNNMTADFQLGRRKC